MAEESTRSETKPVNAAELQGSDGQTGLVQRLKSLFGIDDDTRMGRIQQRRLGQMLMGMGAITESELKEALNEQHRSGGLLGEVLLQKGLIDRETIMIALSRLFDIEYAPLDKAASERNAIEAMAENIAVKYRLLPVRLEEKKLTVLIEKPQSRDALSDVSMLLGLELNPVLTSTEDLREEIKTRYHAIKMKKRRPQSLIVSAEERAKLATEIERDEAMPEPDEIKETALFEKPEAGEAAAAQKKESPDTINVPSRTSRFKQLAEQVSGMPVVKMVSTIIEGAINAGATDIHLDPEDPEMRVRYRVDGILHDVMTIPQEIEPAVVSRIKIMADIDITETRHPQDGHISLDLGDRECDIRVATLPTFLGERVVLRILDQSSVFSAISDLGLDEEEEATIRKVIAEPYGMILVTGPTGSGKTTTLYAALNQKDVKTQSIVTLEDPVEYQLSGINQVQIDADIDLTFARTLRATLRQDVDVILIGEIRDQETAHIAARAAMTGHLVFSTLHTNDAPEAISTLRNMGVPSYLLASALTAVIGQRLVRTVCPECRTRFKPTKALLDSLGLPESVKALHRGRGCDKCYHTGYKGRTGIFEILVVTPEIRHMIADEAPIADIIKSAGMLSLAESCRDKLKKGLIPPEEFFRVIRL